MYRYMTFAKGEKNLKILLQLFTKQISIIKKKHGGGALTSSIYGAQAYISILLE